MPVILTDFGLHSYLGVFGHFAHAGWSGGILYFGGEVPAQHLPWHYVYGYLFVQLPLFYHLFLLTFVGVCIIRPERVSQAIAMVDRRASTTLGALLVAAVIPFLLILIVRPVLYDGFRHVLFIVPLLCILFYLGFIVGIGQIGEFARAYSWRSPRYAEFNQRSRCDGSIPMSTPTTILSLTWRGRSNSTIGALHSGKSRSASTNTPGKIQGGARKSAFPSAARSHH